MNLNMGPSFSTSRKNCIITPLPPVMKTEQSLFLKITNFSENSCDTAVANVMNNVTEGQTDEQTHM